MDLETRINASVRVMRSHEYCHFEVALSSAEPVPVAEVNDLRNVAAALVDEGVDQYVEMRAFYSKHAHSNESRKDFKRQIAEVKARLNADPETQLAPAEAAALRSSEDEEFMKQYEERRYNYFDDGRDGPWRQAVKVMCAVSLPSIGTGVTQPICHHCNGAGVTPDGKDCSCAYRASPTRSS